MKNRSRFFVRGLFDFSEKRLIRKCRKSEKTRMKCRKVEKRLSAYQDGEVSEGERLLIKAHLADCPECSKQYKELQQVWETLDNLPDIQAAPGFYSGIHRRISDPRKDRSGVRIRRLFQVLPSPLAVGAPLLVGLLMGIYLGSVLLEEGLPPLQRHQPSHDHVSLASIRTFDAVPPGTLAHGYLAMAGSQEEAY